MSNENKDYLICSYVQHIIFIKTNNNSKDGIMNEVNKLITLNFCIFCKIKFKCDVVPVHVCRELKRWLTNISLWFRQNLVSYLPVWFISLLRLKIGCTENLFCTERSLYKREVLLRRTVPLCYCSHTLFELPLEILEF